MADNVDVTPGTGKTIAADDVGGVLYQRVKIASGPDGSATDLSPYNSTCTITRPANTTAYTAGDVVGGALTFASAGPAAGGAVIITGVQLELDISAIPSGMTSFTLYLYNVTPPSATADNGAWDLPSGDRASYLGSINLGSPADLGSTLYIETNNLNKMILTASGSVYGYLVTSAGYTPAANSEVYKITLHGMGV
jgi:hypothetical protein